MAFFGLFQRRSSPFDFQTFMKTFGGKKKEFKKLNKEELFWLLQFGFEEPKFPLEMFIDYLVEIKWDFNERIRNISLPLNLACSHGKIEIVKKMIENGADVHAKDAYDVNALHEASASGNLDLVEYILSFNVDINARNDNSKESPIFKAIEGGHYDIFVLLLKHGADINTKTISGETLLHIAALHNRIEMLEKLIEMGIDINAESNLCYNVFHFAARDRNREMIKRLIELGGPLQKYCQSPDYIFEDIFSLQDPELTQIFIDNGAKLESNDGKSILFLINGEAKYSYHDDISCYDEADHEETPFEWIEYLFSLNLDVNIQENYYGMTPLMQVCITGTVRQVALFLEHGADPFLTDFEGRTALHYAAHDGRIDIMEYLVRVGKVDVNCRTNNGQTPLHVFRDYQKTLPLGIKTLLELGADINAQDNEGQTLLHIFTEFNCEKEIDLLLKYGARADIYDNKSRRAIDLSQRGSIRRLYAKYGVLPYNPLEFMLCCLS